MIQVNKKYHPLYTSKKSIKLLTGGRGGAKSFNVSLFLKRLSYERGHNIYFTRYTMTSAEKSVIPDFKNKMIAENDEHNFRVTKDEIVNKYSGSIINFTGIKTSSGQQTAKMKGMSELTVFVVDEGEEWQDFAEFEKVLLSARKKGANIMIIIVMNPSDKDHFVYEKFIKDNHKIEYHGGVPIEISTHENVEHIHTTYLDNLEHLDDKWLKYVEEMKDRPEEYAHVIMGAWRENSEGKLYGSSELKNFELKHLNLDAVEYIVSHVDPANEGTDFLCQVIIKVIGRNIYLTDVLFSQENSTYTEPMVIELLRENEVQHCWIETNGVGSLYASNIEAYSYATTIIPYHQASKKHEKIIGQSGFIKKFVHFRTDYEVGSDYDLFMRNLLEYNKDKKENTKIHDDAPDSLSSMTKWLLDWIGEVWR